MIVILTQAFPPDTGGHEVLIGGLAQALCEAGETVTVLADRIRSGDPEIAQPPFSLRRFGGPRPIRRWRKARAAKDLLGEPGVALIADSWKSLEIAPPTWGRVMVLAHGMELPATPSAAKRARIEASLAKAGVVVANSAFTADRVRLYLKADGPKVVVIHPPIAVLPEPSEAARVAMAAVCQGGGLVLATLSRLEPRKGIDQIIKSLPGLLERHPDTVYVVAGSGADAARLQNLADEEGVAEQVRFLGRVDEDMKAALLHRADVFVMPVRREGNSVEGFGISYVEAAWHGAPALAGREGGAGDAVLDGETGLICEGADLDDVSQKLHRLCDDPELRERLGAAAQNRARAMTWEEVGPQYLSALNSAREERRL